MLPKCLLSIFLSPHLSSRLPSCLRFSVFCLSCLFKIPVRHWASCQPAYIFACRSTCCNLPYHLYLYALLSAYLSDFLPTHLCQHAPSANQPVCITFCPSFCMLSYPSSFLLVSLLVCLYLSANVYHLSQACLYYVTCLSNRSNYLLSVCRLYLSTSLISARLDFRLCFCLHSLLLPLSLSFYMSILSLACQNFFS